MIKNIKYEIIIQNTKIQKVLAGPNPVELRIFLKLPISIRIKKKKKERTNEL